MKILLTGKNGQVGWELNRLLGDLGELISVGREEMDLAREESIHRTIRETRPDLLINAAAYTAVDKAEEEMDLAAAVNSAAPKIMADEAKNLGFSIIHFSTDYIFDGGKKAGPYLEDDPANPINVYGKTKWAGECAIREAGVPHLIVRTSAVFGDRGKNFYRTMKRLAAECDQLRVVEDQVIGPSWSRSIAKGVSQVLRSRIDHQISSKNSLLEGVSGTYHMTCRGETSWHGFAKAIVERSLSGNKPDLKAIPTSEYPTPAARPKYSVLSNQKLTSIFGVELPEWERALIQCMEGDPNIESNRP